MGQEHWRARGHIWLWRCLLVVWWTACSHLCNGWCHAWPKGGGLYPVAHLCDALVSWIHGCFEKWGWQSACDRGWLHRCQRVCRGTGNTVIALVVVNFNHFHVSDHVRVVGSSHTDHIPCDGLDHFANGWWRVCVHAYLSIILLGHAESCEERLWQWWLSGSVASVIVAMASRRCLVGSHEMASAAP